MKILIVSYAYPPISSPGAMRVKHFAKDLDEFGHDITVLTTSNGYSSMIDNVSGYSEGGVEIIRCRDLINKSGAIAKGIKNSNNNDIKSKIITLARSLMVPDRDISWIPSAITNKEVLKKQYDFVIASYPYATNLIAASIISKKTNSQYIIDMRDLWTQDSNNLKKTIIRQWIEKKLESSLFKGAAGVISISKYNSEILTRHKKLNKTPSTVIRNGFDSEIIPDNSFSQELSTQKFTICYTGSFYDGERDPTEFLTALQHLQTNNVISQSNFQFVIYGKPEPFLVGLISKYNLSSLIVLKGALPQTSLFSEILKANLLLTITRSQQISAGELTTKVYEYIGLGNSILCLTKSGYEIEGLLKDVENSFCVDMHDVHGIYELLNREFNYWLSNNRRVTKREKSDVFSRKNVSKRLECFLKSL